MEAIALLVVFLVVCAVLLLMIIKKKPNFEPLTLKDKDGNYITVTKPGTMEVTSYKNP